MLFEDDEDTTSAGYVLEKCPILLPPGPACMPPVPCARALRAYPSRVPAPVPRACTRPACLRASRTRQPSCIPQTDRLGSLILLAERLPWGIWRSRSSKLKSLFGNEQQDRSRTQSFAYTAPKQPKTEAKKGTWRLDGRGNLGTNLTSLARPAPCMHPRPPQSPSK